MKTTLNGYRLTKNGAPIKSIEKEAFVSNVNLGLSTKQDGTYYFFNRKQNQNYIYLP